MAVSRRRFMHTTGVVAGGFLLLNEQTFALQAGGPRIRKEVRSLNAAELETLRDAYRKLQADSATGGYQTVSGFHGVPGQFCHRPGEAILFLAWHRAYIQEFENALRNHEPDVTLPYWDWTSDASIQDGIPAAFADRTYVNAAGDQVANPLFSAFIRPLNRNTRRNPRPPFLLRQLARLVTNSYQATSYSSFNGAIVSPHNSLHGWVSGDMGSTSFAAYDPVFFVHHGNVDFQWAQWQAGPNNADPDSDTLDIMLNPFNMRVSSVVDYQSNLNYQYQGLQPQPVLPSFNLANVARSGDDIQFRKAIMKQEPRVLLVANELGMSKDSFNIDVFVNQPDADVDTPLEGNERFAGSFAIFGHGTMPAAGNMEMKNMVVLDLTEAVERSTTPSVSLKIVAKTPDGQAVSLDKLPFKGVSIQVD